MCSTTTILVGDVLKHLRLLSAESVHCVITSPPYWGLRDYGVVGQIGLEPTLADHLAVMVDVFREIRRVLRKDGTVWLNYGDCYATSPNGRSAADTKASGGDDRTFRDKPFSTVGPIYVPDYEKTARVGASANLGSFAAAHGGRVQAGGFLKPKDLCMIPNRLAIALQDDGWWIRSEIIWHKPNPMPESIRDRPASAHEKVFLLTKAERYFYDAVAVRTPAKDLTASYKMPDGWDTGEDAHGSFHRNGREKGAVRGRDAYGRHTLAEALPQAQRRSDKQRGHSRRHAGFNDRWDAMERSEQMWAGANLKNVWTIATKPCKEAHFATFPPGLVETPVKAGTSELGVCPHCGAPWRRIVDKTVIPQPDVSPERCARSPEGLDPSNGWGGVQRAYVGHQTIGWQMTCKCPIDRPVPATVLDPFGGSGTVGLVASQLGRRSILIDLNADYIDIALRRLAADAPLLSTVTVREAAE